MAYQTVVVQSLNIGIGGAHFAASVGGRTKTMKTDTFIAGVWITLGLGIVITTIVAPAITFLHESNENRIEAQCHDYERAGVIDQGSCDCTEQLFDTWSKSYDWIDACGIVEKRR